MHRLVAATAFVVHVGFVVFTVIGGFLAWMAPWLFVPHVGVALWGGRQAVTRKTCPLSFLENWGRVGAGKPRLRDGGFIAHYFEGRLYPVTWARRVELVVGGLVIGSWFGFAAR